MTRIEVNIGPTRVHAVFAVIYLTIIDFGDWDNMILAKVIDLLLVCVYRSPTTFGGW